MTHFQLWDLDMCAPGDALDSASASATALRTPVNAPAGRWSENPSRTGRWIAGDDLDDDEAYFLEDEDDDEDDMDDDYDDDEFEEEEFDTDTDDNTDDDL